MLRPLGDRVFIKPDEQAKEYKGIILPENLEEKPRMGTVLAVGHGLVASDTGERTPPDVQIGDHVLFSQYGGVDVNLADMRYMILREGDLLGVIDDAAVLTAAMQADAARVV